MRTTGGAVMNVAHDQCDQAFHFVSVSIRWRGLVAGPRRRQMALEAENAEMSPAGGEIRLGNLLHAVKSHNSILQSCWLDVLQLKMRRPGEWLNGGPSGHAAQRAGSGFVFKKIESLRPT